MNGQTITKFEESWAKHVHCTEVRAFLNPLPQQQAASSSSGNAPTSKEFEKLKNRLSNAEQALKRRRADGGDGPKGGGKGKKGKDKGRRSRASDNAPAPPEWNGLSTKMPDGQRICFAFNGQGCLLAKPGEICWKGIHLCPKCHGKHPLPECPRKA